MAKCSECGFLTLRDRNSLQLVEVIDDYRESGRATKVEYHNYPICFVMAYDLMPEVEREAHVQFQEGKGEWSGYVLRIITRDRDCDKLGKFVKYQQGFTPKEHREMMDRQFMLDWQSRRDDADKKWRARQQWFMVIVAGTFVILGGAIGAIITLIASGQLISLFH